MGFGNRHWVVEFRSDLAQLARDLLTTRFSPRQAFQTPRGTIWANISQSADESCLQEYAILRPASDGSYYHVRTVVVSWSCDYWLRQFINLADRREYDTLFEVDCIDVSRFQFDPPGPALQR